MMVNTLCKNFSHKRKKIAKSGPEALWWLNGMTDILGLNSILHIAPVNAGYNYNQCLKHLLNVIVIVCCLGNV